VFENIKSLRPYFFSLREIESNVSLDIRIPLTWKYDEIIKPYRILNVKIQDKNDKFTLLSLISKATQNGYDVAFACANEIIKLNKEEEEKQRLFQEKVKELEELFKKQSLDKLKDINLLKIDGQEDTTSIGLVEEGNGEGSEGGGDTQESDD
jgi:hypothetical protein